MASSETWLQSSSTNGTSPRIVSSIIPSIVSFTYGGYPISKRYNITPSEYTSAFAEYSHRYASHKLRNST